MEIKMNERIQENWEKATGSAIPGPGFFASASDYNIEKFAELIVKECIDICKERHWTWRWDETTSGPNECANIIKERFGVEE